MIAMVDLFEKSNVDYNATPLRDERLLELRAHQDHEYEALKTAIIKDGWPERKIDLAQNLEPFWSQRYNLSIDEDGFIVKEGRLFVPAGLCQTYLQRLLAMHQQADKMEAWASKVNLLAIPELRHQKHRQNLPSMPRKTTESSS